MTVESTGTFALTLHSGAQGPVIHYQALMVREGSQDAAATPLANVLKKSVPVELALQGMDVMITLSMSAQ